MASLRGFIIGIVFTLSLLLLFVVPVHLTLGFNGVVLGLQSGDLSNISAAAVIAIMTAFSCSKLAVAVRTIMFSSKFPTR